MIGEFRATESSRSVQPEQALIPPAPERTVNVKVTKALGVTQICLGVLTFILGCIIITMLHHWSGKIGLGIYTGSWFMIGGVLGVCSASQSAVRNLNTANLVSAIFSSLISCLGFILSCLAVAGYKQSCHTVYSSMGTDYRCDTPADHVRGLVLYSLLLIVMAVEGGASIAVAVYCIKFTACCSYSQTSHGVIPAQPFVMQLGVPASYPAQPVVSYGAPPVFNAYLNAGMVYPTLSPGQQQLQQNQQQQMAQMPPAGYYQPVNPTAVTYGQASKPITRDYTLPPTEPPPPLH